MSLDLMTYSMGWSWFVIGGWRGKAKKPGFIPSFFIATDALQKSVALMPLGGEDSSIAWII